MPAFVRKFAYKEDALAHRRELDRDRQTEFTTMGKKGGAWNVVYIRPFAYTVGDQPAIRGVDY